MLNRDYLRVMKKMSNIFLFILSGTFQIFYDENYCFHNHKKQKGENKFLKTKKSTSNFYSSGSMDYLGSPHPEMKSRLLTAFSKEEVKGSMLVV